MRKSSPKECADKFSVDEANHDHTDSSSSSSNTSVNNNIVTARSNSEEDDYDDRMCELANSNLDEIKQENECNTIITHSTNHQWELLVQERQLTLHKEDSNVTDNTKAEMQEMTGNDTDRRECTHKSTFTELVDNIFTNKTSNDQDIKCELLSTHEPECNRQSSSDAVVPPSITVNTPLMADRKSYVCSSVDDKENQNVTESNEMLVEACNSTNVAITDMTDTTDVTIIVDEDNNDNDNDDNFNECESSDEAAIDDNDNFEVNMDELAEVNRYLQATGNSPVTPRLMHRIQKEQRRERAAMKRVLHPNAVFVNNTKASPVIAATTTTTATKKINNNDDDDDEDDEEKNSSLRDDVHDTQLYVISASMSASSNTSVPRHSNKNVKTKKKKKNNNSQVERVSVHGCPNAHSSAASSHYSRSLSSHSSHSFSSAEQQQQQHQHTHLHGSSRQSSSNSSTCSNNSRKSNNSNRRVHKEEKLRRQRQHRRQRRLDKHDKTQKYVSTEVLLQNEYQQEEYEEEELLQEEPSEVEEREKRVEDGNEWEEETQVQSLLPRSTPFEKIKIEICEEYTGEETNCDSSNNNNNVLYDKIEKSSSAESLPTLSVEMVESSHRDSEVSIMPVLLSLSEKDQIEVLPHEIDNYDIHAAAAAAAAAATVANANYKQQNTEQSEWEKLNIEWKVEVHEEDEVQEMHNHRYELERSTHTSSRRSSSVAASESLLEPISEKTSITNSSFSSSYKNEEEEELEEEQEFVKTTNFDECRNNNREYSCLSDNDKNAFSAHVSNNNNNNRKIQKSEKLEREESANVVSENVEDDNKIRNKKSIKIKSTISVFKRLQHNTHQIESNASRLSTDKDKAMRKNKEHASTFVRKSSSAATTSVVKDSEL